MKLICLPGVPDDSYKVNLFCRHLGIEMLPPSERGYQRIWTTNQPWKDVRRRSTNINGAMISSEKDWLEYNVIESFGFGYEIDPRTWHGPAVEKWHAHGRHPRVILCPSKGKHNHFYSELLHGDEWRIAIFGEQLICTYTKRELQPDGLPSEKRIAGSSRYNLPWTDAMSPDERSKLLDLTRRLGLDYGELDVIRNHDGRFCVIDVNPGPSSPSPHSFTKEAFAAIIPTESNYFEQLITDRSAVS